MLSSPYTDGRAVQRRRSRRRPYNTHREACDGDRDVVLDGPAAPEKDSVALDSAEKASEIIPDRRRKKHYDATTTAAAAAGNSPAVYHCAIWLSYSIKVIAQRRRNYRLIAGDDDQPH